MTVPPTGTVTFLFTDIEGSTRVWEHHPEAMSEALARHDKIPRDAVAAHGGCVFRTVGDAFCATFPTAPDALLPPSERALRESYAAARSRLGEEACEQGQAEGRAMTPEEAVAYALVGDTDA